MPSKPLTIAGCVGMLRFPKPQEAYKRLFCLSKTGKRFVRVSAVEAPAIAGGWFSIQGRVTTSSIRKDWRLLEGRGALSPCLFLFPKPQEAFQ